MSVLTNSGYRSSSMVDCIVMTTRLFLPVLMDSMPLPLKHSMSSISVFQATLSALGSRNNNSLESMSYTKQLELSSTIAIFLRLLEMSKQRTADCAWINSFGKGLSTNIWRTEPDFKPTARRKEEEEEEEEGQTIELKMLTQVKTIVYEKLNQAELEYYDYHMCVLMVVCFWWTSWCSNQPDFKPITILHTQLLAPIFIANTSEQWTVKKWTSEENTYLKHLPFQEVHPTL